MWIWRNESRVNPSYVSNNTLNTIRWIISIRYRIALSLCAIVFACSFVFPQPISTVLFPLPVVLAYLGVNAWYCYLLRGSPSPERVNFVRRAQLPLELLVATAGIYTTGGVLTP